MAAISSPGIGSGLDIGNLVSQLVAAEGQATSVRLDQKEAGFQAELSAVGTMKAALSEFQDALENLKSASFFSNRSATSADTDLFTATATNAAAIGSYDIEVVQLAQASKLRTAGFTNASTVVGTGTLTITSGSDSIVLTINSNNDTLEEIRDAINDATGNTFVGATIVNVDDGMGGTESRLVLAGTKVGATNALTITVDDDDLNDTDASGLSQLVNANLTTLDSAQDAIINIDTQAVTRDSNSISDAIDGITFELLSETATPGTTTRLNVSVDTGAVQTEVQKFVDAYNNMIKVFNELSSFNSATGQTGTLFGDATLRTVESQIRRDMTDPVSGLTGTITSLVNLGITTNADDTITLDTETLTDAIADNLDDITTLFSSSDGVATKIDSLISDYVNTAGVIDSRTESLNEQIEDINDQREALSRRLASLESRLLSQFTALDTLISQMNSTSTFLSQQLANLPGAINPNKES